MPENLFQYQGRVSEAPFLALSAGELQLDWLPDPETNVPDARWEEWEWESFDSVYVQQWADAPWIYAAVTFVEPEFPSDRAGGSISGQRAASIKIVRGLGQVTLGGIVPVEGDMARFLASIGRERPYKTPSGFQPPCWNYFHCGPGLSNPGEGHFLIQQQVASAIEAAIAEDPEKKISVIFEDGQTGVFGNPATTAIQIQVVLAEPIRVVHYEPLNTMSGSLYELHVYDTRGYLLNKNTDGGAVYNLTADSPTEYYKPSLIDFPQDGANADTPFTWLQVINHLWQNYTRIHVGGAAAASWDLLPSSGEPGAPLLGGFTFPSHVSIPNLPEDQKYAWCNSAAAIDSVCEQNGMFVTFDPRTNTASIVAEPASATEPVGFQPQIYAAEKFQVAGERGTVFSPWQSNAVRRHLIPGRVVVVFPVRWEGGEPETSPDDANAIAVTSLVGYGTDHPASVATPPLMSDTKQTKVIYDGMIAVKNASNNVTNESALLARVDYLAERFWGYENLTRVGPRTDIGFHGWSIGEEVHSICWQLTPSGPFTHINNQWRRPGALYPWDRDPTGVEFAGLGGTQIVAQGRGRWGIRAGGGAAAASVQTYKINSISEAADTMMVRLQNPVIDSGVLTGWTDAPGAIDVVAYPDAYAKAHVNAGDSMSDWYAVGFMYWAFTVSGVLVLHHVRRGINDTFTYVVDVTWNQTTCQFVKTTKVLTFEDGLLQSNV